MGGAGFMSRFAVTALAVWRVTHLLAEEDGPGDVVARARSLLGESRLGELADCFNCMSVWVAAPASLAVARRPRDLLLTWLALSGAACLLEQATSRPQPAGADETHEQGADDGLLRPQEEGRFEKEQYDAGELARGADGANGATALSAAEAW